MENISMKYQRMTENAFPPERGSDYAAGLDLRAAYSDVIPARGAGKLIKTDLAIELPVGCYGRIAPRSGLAYKNSIDVGGGVIDRDYRGNVGVILYNHHPTQDFKVNRGDRIAQLILERCYENVQLVESEKPLEKTTRGEKGFGSTGIKNEFLQDVVYDEVVYDTTSSIPINQQNCLVNYLNILMKTFQQYGNGNSFVLTLYGNVKQNKEDVMNYLEKNSKNYSCIDITTNDDDKWNSLINKSCQIKEVENEMLKGNIENKKRIILYMFPDIFYYVQTIKNQSNLYNLLNYILMEDNDETQRVVIAFTEQVDFTEHLEKRVLSRFTQLSLESTWRTRDNSMEQEQDNGMSFIQDSLARLNQIQFRLLVYMLNIYSLNYKEFIKNKNHKIIDYITYEQIIEIFEKKHWKDQSSFSTSTLQDILISHVNLSLVVLIDFGLVHNENPISTSNYSLNQTDIVQGHYLINVDWDDLCDYMEKNEKLGNFTQIPMDVRIIIESKGTKLLI